jgi:hypothetical protein
MKKLTVILPDDTKVDLTELIEASISFHVEEMEKKSKRKFKSGSSVKSSIMEHFSPDKIFSLSNAKNWVEDDGYNPNSAIFNLNELKKEGFLEFLGRGNYRFLKPRKE